MPLQKLIINPKKDSTDNKENTDQADSEEADDSDNVYKNGTFEGSGTGYGGTITVQVTLEDDTITAVSVVSAPGEDSAYLSQGENVINSIISEQSTDVDTISGATFSSTGILEAVNDALSKAEKRMKKETTKGTADPCRHTAYIFIAAPSLFLLHLQE